MMARRSYHHAKFGGNRTTHVCVLFFTFLCVNNAPQITDVGDLVALLQQEIALVFVGRFRCGLQFFFGEEEPFQHREQI